MSGEVEDCSWLYTAATGQSARASAAASMARATITGRLCCATYCASEMVESPPLGGGACAATACVIAQLTRTAPCQSLRMRLPLPMLPGPRCYLSPTLLCPPSANRAVVTELLVNWTTSYTCGLVACGSRASKALPKLMRVHDC
jgi:hypothetical protein